MAQFREQRGGFDESMAAVINVQTCGTLADYLTYQYTFPARIDKKSLTVEYLCFDPRNGWDTYLVSVNGLAIGFTDGPLQ